jgi:hypothetical protein
VANKAPGPSFDDIHKLVGDVMKVGTRRYEFSSEVPWFVSTDVVQERTRSRLPDDVALEASWVDHDLSAAEVLGIAADAVYPENDEGLLAIGERKGARGREMKWRTRRAAAARGNVSETSDRDWRGRYMKPFIRLTAKELYRMVRYPPDSEQADSQSLKK